jgi:hypothetical protein
MEPDNEGRCRMQQVADWLEKLRLGRYTQRFVENDISFGILPHLTDQDLKDLGITSIGHRRQLLLAMAELKDVRKDAAKPPSEVAEPLIPPQDTAERRQGARQRSARTRNYVRSECTFLQQQGGGARALEDGARIRSRGCQAR